MTALHDYYAREADRIARGPQTYGGNAAVASLRTFRRYHKDATVDFVSTDGVLHWMTHKQMRVHGILARLAVSGSPSTVRAIAAEARACPSTVSRAILKLQAWGEYAVDIKRGRYGGVRVWKVISDRFADYARAARQKLAELASKARSMLRPERTSMEQGPEGYVVTGRNIEPGINIGSVLYARAYLALEDPEGESGATNPLTPEQIERGLNGVTERDADELLMERENELMRQAAFENDWETWERIRIERLRREAAARGDWRTWASYLPATVKDIR